MCICIYIPKNDICPYIYTWCVCMYIHTRIIYIHMCTPRNSLHACIHMMRMHMYTHTRDIYMCTHKNDMCSYMYTWWPRIYILKRVVCIHMHTPRNSMHPYIYTWWVCIYIWWVCIYIHKRVMCIHEYTRKNDMRPYTHDVYTYDGDVEREHARERERAILFTWFFTCKTDLHKFTKETHTHSQKSERCIRKSVKETLKQQQHLSKRPFYICMVAFVNVCGQKRLF